MKIDLFVIAILMVAMLTLAAYGAEEAERSPITIHVLDTGRGKPAASVTVILEQADGEEWREVAKGKTDNNGRIDNILPKNKPVVAGIYRITFDSGAYYAESKTKTFYPRITVYFEIVDPNEHYHIPLLLSPFGYSTYRGS
jgi:5-hydroxyisourate hydrolase